MTTLLFDPQRLPDTAADSLAKDLGQFAQLEARLVELRHQLATLPESTGEHERAGLQLELARALQVLGRGAEAWPVGRMAFDALATAEDWERAADACDVLYQTEQAGSLAALGQGIWLGVTFPIDPEISVHLLSHVVDDTPDDADGAAVAAATAAFLADLRAPQGPDRDRLVFFANQLLGRVARRHGQVADQEAFDRWVRRLELDEPDKFLVRLRNVVDVLVQDDWWIDRDAIQSRLTVD
jgi:hypothetical protein